MLAQAQISLRHQFAKRAHVFTPAAVPPESARSLPNFRWVGQTIGRQLIWSSGKRAMAYDRVKPGEPGLHAYGAISIASAEDRASSRSEGGVGGGSADRLKQRTEETDGDAGEKDHPRRFAVRNRRHGPDTSAPGGVGS